MKDLIERLEKCIGPDRELANDVLFASGWALHETQDGPDRHPVWESPDGLGFEDGDQPDPTASIDAALTLVPPDHDWIVGNVNGQVGGTPYACCGSDKAHYGETPVLSLCIAALKARDFAERDLTKMEASNG